MAAEHAERIGARIKAAREDLGLTQNELADRMAGKSDGTQVSKWERGANRPTDTNLEQIAKALGKDISWFLMPEPDKNTTPDLFGITGAGEGGPPLDRLATVEELLRQVLARQAEFEDHVRLIGQSVASLLAADDAAKQRIDELHALVTDVLRLLQRRQAS